MLGKELFHHALRFTRLKPAETAINTALIVGTIGSFVAAKATENLTTGIALLVIVIVVVTVSLHIVGYSGDKLTKKMGLILRSKASAENMSLDQILDLELNSGKAKYSVLTGSLLLERTRDELVSTVIAETIAKNISQRNNPKRYTYYISIDLREQFMEFVKLLRSYLERWKLSKGDISTALKNITLKCCGPITVPFDAIIYHGSTDEVTLAYVYGEFGVPDHKTNMCGAKNLTAHEECYWTLMFSGSEYIPIGEMIQLLDKQSIQIPIE